MPGHTAGHCVLLVEPQGIAFIGDFDLSSFGPYYGDATSSLADFRRSLQRLAELPASVWITSHHKGVIDDRARFLDTAASLRRTHQRTRGAIAADAGGRAAARWPIWCDQRLLYPPEADDLWVDCAEARSIAQHLDELLAAGRVVLDDDGRYGLAGHRGQASPWR